MKELRDLDDSVNVSRDRAHKVLLLLLSQRGWMSQPLFAAAWVARRMPLLDAAGLVLPVSEAAEDADHQVDWTHPADVVDPS